MNGFLKKHSANRLDYLVETKNYNNLVKCVFIKLSMADTITDDEFIVFQIIVM